MRKEMIILMISAALIIAACTTKTNDDNTGLANPASVFCKDNRGTLEIVTGEDGSQSGVCTLQDGTKCEEWAYFRGECPINYEITETLDTDCSVDHECTTPIDYSIRSNCPYTTKCLSGKCTVVCPIFDGEGYPEVKECGLCPEFMPPGPDFCKEGKIIDGGKNDCGCQMPPKCVEESEEGEKNFCTERTPACTKEYNPVCGWFNQKIKCIKYPCASTYANRCIACSDEKVEYYTEGQCPD
ncbi:MAG: DUF333 domain-containing protein [Nanoarchaeota archaeon]|nr:DUF333 domain-containing protein [Nanoarchaeota archaeon]